MGGRAATLVRALLFLLSLLLPHGARTTPFDLFHSTSNRLDPRLYQRLSLILWVN